MGRKPSKTGKCLITVASRGLPLSVSLTDSPRDATVIKQFPVSGTHVAVTDLSAASANQRAAEDPIGAAAGNTNSKSAAGVGASETAGCG